MIARVGLTGVDIEREVRDEFSRVSPSRLSAIHLLFFGLIWPPHHQEWLFLSTIFFIVVNDQLDRWLTASGQEFLGFQAERVKKIKHKIIEFWGGNRKIKLSAKKGKNFGSEYKRLNIIVISKRITQQNPARGNITVQNWRAFVVSLGPLGTIARQSSFLFVNLINVRPLIFPRKPAGSFPFREFQTSCRTIKGKKIGSYLRSIGLLPRTRDDRKKNSATLLHILVIKLMLVAFWTQGYINFIAQPRNKRKPQKVTEKFDYSTLKTKERQKTHIPSIQKLIQS